MKIKCPIQYDPHYRIEILQNASVNATTSDDDENCVIVCAELRNVETDTLSSVDLVVVAYDKEGDVICKGKGDEYLTIHEGQVKCSTVQLIVSPEDIAQVRLYAETEYDEDDPFVSPTPIPDCMKEYAKSVPSPEA